MAAFKSRHRRGGRWWLIRTFNVSRGTFFQEEVVFAVARDRQSGVEKEPHPTIAREVGPLHRAYSQACEDAEREVVLSGV
jgi:hypothetical protein